MGNLKNSKYADKFRCIQKIGDFFLATNFGGHTKTLRDSISSILWMSRKFLKIYDNHYSGKFERELSYDNLKKALYAAADTEICINTHSILEDYTKLCVYFIELGFFKIFNNSSVSSRRRIPLCDNFLTNIIDVLDDLNKETSFTILRQKLGWIITQKSYADFFYTCMAIYDLSLMTRFHPLLLFRKQELTIDELIIPFRFNRLIKFFNDNNSTIYDYCDPFTEQWKGFDKICRELKWFSFSECMESIYDLYDLSSYRDTYYGILSRKIVRRREIRRTEKTEEEIRRRTKMGRKENDKPYPVGYLPTLVFFDDLLIMFKEDGMPTGYGIEKRAILKKAIYDFVSWTFFAELFDNGSHDGFKDTKRILNKMSPEQFDVKGFLKESGIGNYVQLTK